MKSPVLSIVIPTREGFSERWITELLKVIGDVEFIVVHPPQIKSYPAFDSRLRQIISPIRGEIIQRICGIENASGTYLLSMNCDEYVNPNMANIAVQYFQAFPDSWVMRLSKKEFKFGDRVSLEAPWATVQNIDELKICGESQGNTNLYGDRGHILEIPIAPIDNPFDFGVFFRNRKDQNGIHTENFDKKVWKNDIVQETIKDLSSLMTVYGALKYIPFWCLDRLLGLFIQAKFFEKGKIVGHLLPPPEQIRCEENPPNFRKSQRFYVFAEILLLRRFPQYGYFWNLVIDQLRGIPVRGVKWMLRKLSGGGSQETKVS